MPLNQDLLTIKDNIQNSVSNIIEAIQLKYVDVNIDNVKLSNLDSYINNIPIDIDTQKKFPIGCKFGNSTFKKLPTELLYYISSLYDLTNMFANCSNLEDVTGLDVSKATILSYLFNSCSNLVTIPLMQTENVTNMRNAFYSCKKIKTVPVSNTSLVRNMFNMCNGCTMLETFENFDTSNVENFDSCFNRCSNLVTVDYIDLIKCININSMFNYCEKLTNLKLNNFGNTAAKLLNLSFSSLLTNESFNYIILNAKDNSSNAGYKIQLHSEVKNKLTNEEIALATTKGYTIA